MKKKNNITQLTAKQFSGMSRQAVALGKSIVAQEGKVLTEWLALGRLVLVSGFRQADVIRMLAKNGVKLDKSDLNKAVTCAKWKTKKKKFTSLNAMYEKAPRKQKSGKRAKKKKTQVVVTTRKAKSLAERFVPANKRDAFVRALGLTA